MTKRVARYSLPRNEGYGQLMTLPDGVNMADVDRLVIFGLSGSIPLASSRFTSKSQLVIDDTGKFFCVDTFADLINDICNKANASNSYKLAKCTVIPVYHTDRVIFDIECEDDTIDLSGGYVRFKMSYATRDSLPVPGMAAEAGLAKFDAMLVGPAYIDPNAPIQPSDPPVIDPPTPTPPSIPMDGVADVDTMDPQVKNVLALAALAFLASIATSVGGNK